MKLEELSDNELQSELNRRKKILMNDWNKEQGAGEAALRRLEKERLELPERFAKLQNLVEEMWTEADEWHGDKASSHYRSRIRERAAELGVLLP